MNQKATAITAITQDGERKDGDVVSFVSQGEQIGDAVVAFPLLQPTDNADEIIDEEIIRVRKKVRITRANLSMLGGGEVVVHLPEAGQDSMFGPMGSQRAFASIVGALEFVGLVLGQVTHTYEEWSRREWERYLGSSAEPEIYVPEGQSHSVG